MSLLADLTPDELTARLAGDDPAARAAVIRAAAQAGEPEGQALWGQLLLDGDGVARDPVAAFGWFNRAAAGGHLMALNMVGRCYDQGWGVAVDPVRAAECFRVAAERGLAEGMYNHATALALGTGVAADRAAALGWFERADALGYAKAANFVGSFAEDGWVGPVDLDHAAQCYARAAAGGDFRGAFNHARMLLAVGDADAAAMWIGRAADWGHARFREQMRGWLIANDPDGAGLAAMERGRASC